MLLICERCELLKCEKRVDDDEECWLLKKRRVGSGGVGKVVVEELRGGR